LRTGAGLDYSIVTVMPLNADVQVIDKPVDGWYPLTFGSLTGWASGDYLASGPPDPNIQVEPVSSAGWQWPIHGPITSYFGPSHPLGIDIGTETQIGLPVVAANDGQVIVAGGDPCCNYGYYVMLQHANGYTTLYGHFSQIEVSVGQWVSRGQEIGKSGNTGHSTGPHVHFELRLGGVPLNPLDYLP
jgi:murein DD-endopeptidase MepM/ murein hydrolase activator NlpD